MEAHEGVCSYYPGREAFSVGKVLWHCHLLRRSSVYVGGVGGGEEGTSAPGT